MTENEFASWMGEIARRDMQKTGVLASVTTAQAILESGYGTTELARNANNYFGMKADLSGNTWPGSTWNGSIYTKITQEDDGAGHLYSVRADFRAYPSVDDSVADHSAYLLGAMNGSRKRYEGLAGEKDPQKAIQIIKIGGYATDTKYEEKIIDIIRRFDLTAYDREEENMITPKNIINVMPQNAGQVPRHKNSAPTFIVIHYLGVANADNPNLYGGGYGGHFYVSRAGDVYQAADPQHDVVWQCGGGRQGYDPGSGAFFGVCDNFNSIGIENGVCYDGTWYFSTETQESLVWLVSYLMDRYNIPIDHVIRHWDVTGKHCPAPYVENTGYKTNWTWQQFKEKLAAYRGGGGKTATYSFRVQQVRAGDTGKYVLLGQKLLRSRGIYTGALDASYGPQTKRAVLDYQKFINGHGGRLAEDGILGPATWTDITGIAGDVKTVTQVKIMDKSISVFLAQQILRGMGYYTGELDREFGPATEKAVKAFQKDAKIKQDGICGPTTFKKLIGVE